MAAYAYLKNEFKEEKSANELAMYLSFLCFSFCLHSKIKIYHLGNAPGSSGLVIIGDKARSLTLYPLGLLQ